MSGKKTRSLDLFIIVFFLLVAALCVELFRRDLMQTFILQDVEPVGTVVVKKNTAQRRLGDRMLWDRLARESPVYLWDLIRIADNSSATLYVKDNSISLGENTLVRIVPSPDGEGIMLVLNQGTVSIAAGKESREVSLEINGQQIRFEHGNLITASTNDYGMASYQKIENIEQYKQNITVSETQQTELINPSVNSVIRYTGSSSALNFQWTETEDAVSYILEVSRTPDFFNPRIRRQTTANFVTETSLEQGVWYWRVRPVMPSVFSGEPDFTAPSFFSVEPVNEEIARNISLSQWLEMEIASAALPPDVPEELIPQSLRYLISSPPETESEEETQVVMEPDAQLQQTPPQIQTQTQPQIQAQIQPQTQPRPQPQQPASPLSVPQNLQPVNRTIFGNDELQSQREILFRWNAVQGANAYIFTLYQQMSSGRRQIIRTTITGTSYSFNNFRLLDRGTFIWQIEPIVVNRNNEITRRGRTAESNFIIDLPSVGPVEIEDTGILYGS